MAPKLDKNKEKAKAKVIEDKTFGIKNKSKSKAVQNYVKQLENSMVPSQKQLRAQGGAAINSKDKKKAEEERQKELNSLFAVAIKQPKVPAGVDPKSVLCEFFRHGQCTKGFKCKYSHDLSVERKGPKIDLFTDQRDLEEGDKEGMDDWDQETLERVVKEKHGNDNNATTIICKHFLEAVEKKLYGWFWKCPNSSECKYRHALPAGYVLKSQMKELLEEEARNQKDMTELIEEERSKVDGKTPITQEVFLAWHRKRTETKRRKNEDAVEERKRKGVLTGREMFMQEGFTAHDDANADDDDEREDRNEEERKIQEMLDRAAAEARAARERAQSEAAAAAHDDDDEQEQKEAQATPSTNLKLAGDEADALFDGDDDEDEDFEDDLDEGELEELEQGIRAQVGIGS